MLRMPLATIAVWTALALSACGGPEVTHALLATGTDTLPATLGSAVGGMLSLLPLSP